MNKLQKIFNEVPEGCTEVRLSIRLLQGGVVTKKDMYALTGFIYFGAGVWQRFEALQDQVEVTDADIAEYAPGWAMGKKMSRTANEYIYPFTPDQGQQVFHLHSRTAEVGERRRKEELFARFDLERAA